MVETRNALDKRKHHMNVDNSKRSYLANSFSVHCRHLNVVNIVVQFVCL